MPSPAPPPRSAIVAMVLGAISLAGAAYTPWVPRPFDILDFSEFLPILQREPGLFGQFFALLDYYVIEHGRLNLVSYAALALKWSLLGNHPMLWYWLRFAQMGILVAGVYLLARRLGANWTGAAVGASLLVSARAAQEAWVRVTMGEPLGLGFMLAAALLVTDRRLEDRWPAGVAATAGACVAAAILAKEMLVAWVPALLGLAACSQEDGTLGPPRWTPHTRRQVVAIGFATLLASLAVLLAAARGSGESFTASYGNEGYPLSRLPFAWNRMVLPENTSGGPGWWLQRPNLFFAVTCLAGLAVGLRAPESRRHVGLVAALAVGLPALGGLIYLPWPYFLSFYALPFLVGPALLLAISVTAVERHAPRIRWAVYTTAAAFTAFAAMASGYVSRVTIGHQQIHGDVVQVLPRYGSVDSILVAGPTRPVQPWQGRGPTLVRYALSIGAATELPPATDILCSELPREVHRPNILLISYSYYCGDLPGATLRLRRSFRFLDYVTLAVGTDSVGADLIAP